WLAVSWRRSNSPRAGGIGVGEVGGCASTLIKTEEPKTRTWPLPSLWGFLTACRSAAALFSGRLQRRLASLSRICLLRLGNALNNAKASVSGGSCEFRLDRAPRLQRSVHSIHQESRNRAEDQALHSCALRPKLLAVAALCTLLRRNHRRIDSDLRPLTHQLCLRVRLHHCVGEVRPTRKPMLEIL